jgi:glycerol uptake facilitator-like aquaporin
MIRRQLASEALGTCLLVMAVVGSGIMAQGLTTDTAVALLANTIATGAGLFMLITILGPVSGAQMNPVVTLVFAMRREIPPKTAVGYIMAQSLGGLVGTLLAHAMFELPLLETSHHIRSGGGQFLSEILASFGLILTILGALQARANVAAAVACYIVAAYWFTASTSFANPAVALARGFTDSFAGIRPADLPLFWTAEVLGALLALTLGNWLFSRDS